MYIVLKHD